MMKSGKLIVFEGISGTGKETQARLLQKFLHKKNIISHIVFHPSPELKKELQKVQSTFDQISLLARDRRERVTQVIRPALQKGEWVISLRSYVSAYVYQGDGEEVEKIDQKPDWLFYFDAIPEVALKRILARGERLGSFEKISLLREKRRRYKQILRGISHITINAEKPIDEVHAEVVKYIL